MLPAGHGCHINILNDDFSMLGISLLQLVCAENTLIVSKQVRPA